MLPLNTTLILKYLGFIVDLDFNGSRSNDVYTLTWLSGATRPTDQEIIDVGNSSEFAIWYAEHGGDPILTLRRQAKEYIDSQDKAEANIFRAFVLITLDEVNALRSHVTQILDAIDSGNNLSQIQANILAIPNLPQRTAIQVRNAIKAKTTAGEADS